MTTGDNVLRILESNPALDVKREGNGYRLNSPLRPGSNSHGFKLEIAPDGEHGKFFDHAAEKDADRSGSLYTLAQRLGIALPEQAPATETKRTYANLAEYAAAHGVPLEAFTAARWEDGHTRDNRPAFQFIVNGQKRYRFKDGGKPPFKSEFGFTACWYGLERAIAIAEKNGSEALILCNGEPSVIAAQYHGLPAVAESGGEKALREHNIRALREKWTGAIWIALDSDKKGRAAAEKIAAQIPGSQIIDLKLGDKGDLGDFASLYGGSAYTELKRRVSVQQAVNPPQTEAPVPALPERPKALTSREIARRAVDNFAETMTGKPLINPLRQFHFLGGFAKFFMPKKISAWVAMSGNGKTTFLECLVDPLLIAGEGGVWYGSEWDDMEYHWRRIHRETGISYEQLMAQELAKWEIDAGVTEAEGHGVLLSASEQERYLAASESVFGWRGQVQYFPAQEYLEDILIHMSDEIAIRRKAGERVTFAVIDYVQLLNVMDTDKSNVPELALGKIKRWTEANNLHTFVGSQVTKSGSSGGRDNKILTVSDAHFMREDKVNLFTTLNPVYEEDLHAPNNIDGTTPKVMSNRAVAAVLKNNAGRKGNVHLHTDFPRLRWIDRGWTVHKATTNPPEDSHEADTD